MFGEGFDDPMFAGGAGRIVQNDYKKAGNKSNSLISGGELGANFGEKKGVIPRCIYEVFEAVKTQNL
jgi:hypothetical protein